MLKKLHEVGDLSSVVDVGCGSGTYHDLLAADLPGAHWTGVEVWEPYVERYALRQKYDKVAVSDARLFDFASVAPASIVLFGDVVEHMTKAEAVGVIERARAVAPYVMISIPVVPYPQDEIEGNPYEVHVKDDWSHYEVMLTFAGISGFLIHHHIGVYFLAGTAEASERIAALQRVIPDLLHRNLPQEKLAWGSWAVANHL